MAKKLSEVKRDNDQYSVQSRKRLESNLERKFKKVFGTALYIFETVMREEIEKNPEIHREFKSELFRVGNKVIQNMKKEINCYNIEYIPVTFKMKGPETNED